MSAIAGAERIHDLLRFSSVEYGPIQPVTPVPPFVWYSWPLPCDCSVCIQLHEPGGVMTKKKTAEDEPTDKADKRSRLEESKQAAKEAAEAQREIVKKIRKLLH
jgi:hypothetical protein